MTEIHDGARVMGSNIEHECSSSVRQDHAHPASRGVPKLQPRSAPRCGARTRRGTDCQRRPFDNGRCRNHGGLSTGAKTVEGRARISAAQRGRWQRWRDAKNLPAVIILPDQSKQSAAPPPVLTGQQQATDGWDGIFFS